MGAFLTPLPVFILFLRRNSVNNNVSVSVIYVTYIYINSLQYMHIIFCDLKLPRRIEFAKTLSDNPTR